MLGDETDAFNEFLAPDFSLPDADEALDACRERKYSIRSVVNHIGWSASCGHYTADVARCCPDGEWSWTRFNDSFVSRVSPKEAIEDSTRTAYLIMYEFE